MMAKHAWFHSLKARLAVVSVVLVVGVSALLTMNYVYTIDAVYREIYQNVERTLALYTKQLSDSCRAMSLYLCEYVNSRDVDVIASDKRDTTAWGAAVSRIQRKFSVAQSLYPADGFFLYVPETGLFMPSVPINQDLRREIRDSIDLGEWGDAHQRGKWISLEPAEQGYIYRAIHYGQCYIGAWINAPCFLSELSSGSTYGGYCFSDENGTILGEPMALDPKLLDGDYAFATVDGQRQMLIAQKCSFANMYLVSFVPDNEIKSGISGCFSFGFFVMGAVILLLISGIVSMQQWVLMPIRRLTEAIRRLQQGNWRSNVEEKGCTEFVIVNRTFNEMIAEVENLKIDVYEEKLTRQLVEINYLKKQVAPHFLINCLNTIYQLSDTQHPDLARQMADELSRHIRYTLSAGSFVPLSQELEHVENYIRLSNIRYHDAILYIIEAERELHECRVVPLLILNFVENTIKHEVCVGRSIEIHIRIHSLTDNGGDKLSILIWDTGTGFSTEFLEQTGDMGAYLQKDEDAHVGIRNVMKRAQMLFGECEFRFSNREGAGAQVEIRLPRLPYMEKAN